MRIHTTRHGSSARIVLQFPGAIAICGTPLRVLLVLIAGASIVPAEEIPNSPFVIGYERFFRNPADEDTSGGRLLLTELSCTACHTTSNRELGPKGGPILSAVGSRVQATWIEAFLADPQHVKPGTTMPDVLHHLAPEEKQKIITSLVAYLRTQQVPFPEVKSTALRPVAFEFYRKGDVERGLSLFHQIGCVACHAPDPKADVPTPPKSDLDERLAQLTPEERAELGLADVAQPVASIPLGDLAAKYTRESLTHFLLNPPAVRPAGRMPHFELSPDEAADICAYLLQDQPAAITTGPPKSSEELAASGKEWFGRLGCARCHEVADTKFQERLAAPPLDMLREEPLSGCLNPNPERAPRFSLDEAQRESLQSVLVSAHPPQEQAPSHALAKNAAQQRMLQLNCYGCHERDGLGGVGPQRRGYFENTRQVDIGDEGRLPPPLSHVGRKLTPKWLAQVLKGSGDVRPHLLARMPVFPAPALGTLADDLTKADLPEAGPSPSFKATPELAQAGRLLMDTGCVQCHGLRGEQLAGVVGVDIANVSQRIRPEWFHNFLLNPASLKPRTRMPTFFPNGRSSNQQILDGDVDKQIAALWTYLNDPHQPLPEKIERGKTFDFTLVPSEQPIVMRTFMKAAGTHAIAVGFPQGVHFAFDSNRSRVAELWRGRFLDAHGTWFDRFTPPAEPLGQDVMPLPTGPAWALLETPHDDWPTESTMAFRGYRLDAAGTPTFLYENDSYRIEDRIEPHTASSLRRTIRILPRASTKGTTAPPSLWFRLHAGENLQVTGAKQVQNEQGLTVHLVSHPGDAPVVHTGEMLSDWRLPCSAAAEQTVEVTYEW